MSDGARVGDVVRVGEVAERMRERMAAARDRAERGAVPKDGGLAAFKAKGRAR